MAFNKKYYESELEDLLNLIKEKNNCLNEQLVSKAFWLGQDAHKNQLRSSGEPYYIHPIAVAKVLAKKGLANEVICAALLHDVIEDTEITSEEFEKIFGKKIHQLVEGVTKIDRLARKSNELELAKNLQKIFMATSKDLRVILIKLADNLHNLETLQHLSRQRQLKYARLAIEIYAPLAKRLGIHEWMKILEDYSYKFLNPEEYLNIKNFLDKKVELKTNDIKQVINILNKDVDMKKLSPTFKIQKRSPCSVKMKTIEREKGFEEIEDFAILTISVDKISECYLTLGKLHEKFIPVPKKIKDFIGMPIDDLYQAIHTTIIIPGGNQVKIHIRTREMEELYQDGIIPLLLKKYQKPACFTNKIALFQDLTKADKNYSNEHAFMKALKSHYLDDKIHVFDNDGDMWTLPSGFSALDYAYYREDEKGHCTNKIKINGKNAPLWQELESGDRIELAFGNKSKVEKSWLDYVKSPVSRRKIRETIGTSNIIGKEITIELRTKVANKRGILLKIVETISKQNIQISSVFSTTKKPNPVCNFTLVLTDKKKFERIIGKLNKLEEILEIEYKLTE